MAETDASVITHPSTSSLFVGHPAPKPGEERPIVGTWNNHRLVKLFVVEKLADNKIIARVYTDREPCCEEDDYAIQLTVTGRVEGRFIPQTEVLEVSECTHCDA
jgi:hypothetical protein